MKRKLILTALLIGFIAVSVKIYAQCTQSSRLVRCYVSANAGQTIGGTYYITSGVPLTISSQIASNGFPGGGGVEVDYGSSGMYLHDHWDSNIGQWNYNSLSVSSSDNNGVIGVYASASQGTTQVNVSW